MENKSRFKAELDKALLAISESTVSKSLKAGDLPVSPSIVSQIKDNIRTGNRRASQFGYWPRSLDTFLLWATINYLPDPEGEVWATEKYADDSPTTDWYTKQSSASHDIEMASKAIQDPGRVLWHIGYYFESKMSGLKDNPYDASRTEGSMFYDFLLEQAKDRRFLQKLNNISYHKISDKYGVAAAEDSQFFDDFAKWFLLYKKREAAAAATATDKFEATRHKCTDGVSILDVGDGFTWYDLQGETAVQDGKSLGHCGNQPRIGSDDRMYSLRKNGIPHVTMSLSLDGIVRDMVGVGDKKPPEKYYKYVVPILKEKSIVRKIIDKPGAKRRFVLTDLPEPLRQELLDARPDLTNKGNRRVSLKRQKELRKLRREQEQLDREAGLGVDYIDDEIDPIDWMDA